jgi:hypothetical protein
VDDEVAGPDAHIAILRGPRHPRGAGAARARAERARSRR